MDIWWRASHSSRGTRPRQRPNRTACRYLRSTRSALPSTALPAAQCKATQALSRAQNTSVSLPLRRRPRFGQDAFYFRQVACHMALQSVPRSATGRNSEAVRGESSVRRAASSTRTALRMLALLLLLSSSAAPDAAAFPSACVPPCAGLLLTKI